MDTDVESTQSRKKKGQMKSIFLSDSDEEAIMEFVKQHNELYDKTDNSFKDKQKKERLWETLTIYQELTCQHSQEVVQDREFLCLPLQVTTETFCIRSHSSGLDTSREAESEMEISMTSDVTHQPLSTNPK